MKIPRVGASSPTCAPSMNVAAEKSRELLDAVHRFARTR